MSIDWITVAAQLANFLVLVWLLKRFLYRPILDGIDAREAEIAERMGEAKRICDEADAKKAEFSNRLAQLESQQSTALKTANTEAQDLRQKIISEAREQLHIESTAFARDQRAEAERYVAMLQKSGGAALLQLTRKALLDLADQTFEEQMVIQAVKQIDAKGQNLLEIAKGAKEAIVTTRESLSDVGRARLEQQILSRLPTVTLRFVTDPTQAPGLIMRLGAVQVSWTLDSYISELTAILEDRITNKDHAKGIADVG